MLVTYRSSFIIPMMGLIYGLNIIRPTMGRQPDSLMLVADWFALAAVMALPWGIFMLVFGKLYRLSITYRQNIAHPRMVIIFPVMAATFCALATDGIVRAILRTIWEAQAAGAFLISPIFLAFTVMLWVLSVMTMDNGYGDALKAHAHGRQAAAKRHLHRP